MDEMRGRVMRGVILAAPVVLSACRNPEKPKFRLGCLPFPGLFMLHDLAKPHALGQHQYEATLPLMSGEEDRGILYTCRAGFLDLAHIRDAMDRTRYLRGRILPAILNAHEQIALKMAEPDRYVLTFRYPKDWLTMPTEERESIANELSILLAQDLVWAATTWHEIITFYGYKSSVIIPEAQSAFTYDDMMSHIVGMQIAAVALRDAEHEYNEAATLALEAHLAELGVVSEALCGDAIRAVEGMWWGDGDSYKRHLEIGYDDDAVVPWLIPDFAPCGTVEAQPYPLPDLRRIMGRDFRGFMDVEIVPVVWEWDDIRRTLPGAPPRARPREHFAVILEAIRANLRERMGENFDSPDVPTVRAE